MKRSYGYSMFRLNAINNRFFFHFCFQNSKQELNSMFLLFVSTEKQKNMKTLLEALRLSPDNWLRHFWQITFKLDVNFVFLGYCVVYRVCANGKDGHLYFYPSIFLTHYIAFLSGSQEPVQDTVGQSQSTLESPINL